MTIEVANLIIQGSISIAALLALKQISLTKNSLLINSKRESIKYSSELVSFYLNNIIPDLDDIDMMLKDRNFKQYPKIREINIFSRKDLLNSDGGLKNHFDYCNNFFKNKNEDIFKKIVYCANKFESFSTPFVEKVADEQVAFKALGRTYVSSLADLYFFYCFVIHEDGEGYFTNTTTLRRIWFERIQRLGLMKDIEKKTELLFQKTPEKIIKPLGTD